MRGVVDVSEAEKDLPELLDRAAAGEEIIIGRRGSPLARLVPIQRESARRPGAWQGRVWMSDDFDEAPGDMLGR